MHFAVGGVQGPPRPTKAPVPGAPHGETGFFSEPLRPPITSFITRELKKQPPFLDFFWKKPKIPLLAKEPQLGSWDT